MEFKNTLYTNDKLFVLNGLNSNLVDLIYLDPPFNSKRFYSAPIGSKAAGTSFKDMWTWEDVNEAYLETLAGKYPALTTFIASIGAIHSKAMKAYLTYMAQRVIEMQRVLKNTGSLYLHCDPTASHYLKIVLDEIFGRDNFKNEIIWHYRRWTGKAKKFQSLHDIIFFYTKSDEYTYNEQYTPYTAKSLKRKQNYHTRIKGDDVFVTSIDEKGVRENDVWVDIQLLNSQSKERTGYPTQKPLPLLHRIIKSSSNVGDIVLDPFCGCATTCVAAQQLGRKWIGIDIEKKAVSILIERLSDDAGIFKDFINTTIVPQRTDIQIIEPTKSIKERLYKEQNCLCKGCKIQFEIRNLEIDHIIPKSKGGGDYYENYQLLCSACNRMKGDRPMEYLRMKRSKEEKWLREKIIFGE
jgi:site-specific DNA-methyltransferase (adenine-specific)